MNKYTDCMIDLETLSIRPNAVVLSISALGFNPFVQYENYTDCPNLHMLLDIDSQKDREIDPFTVEWWNRQDKNIIDKIFSSENRITVPEALEKLTKFTWGCKRIWAQGTDMDISVLKNLYEWNGQSVPWYYGTFRDCRTVLDLAVTEESKTTHDSSEDIIRQTKKLQEALSKLKITKFVH